MKHPKITFIRVFLAVVLTILSTEIIWEAHHPGIDTMIERYFK